MTSQIDYKALFIAAPNPNLVLSPGLVIVDVNEAYLRATGRTREELIGQYMFDAFPRNPADPHATGMQDLYASLHRVLRTKTQDTMALTKYDIPRAGRPGAFEERWWSPINTPVVGPDGQVAWIIHRVEDVTPFIQARADQPARTGERDRALSEREAMDAELYVRARELQRLNEELRHAHARERQVAVTLQETMLRSPDLAHHEHITVRYLPAASSLNVCGDWYDVIDLPENGFAVAVGDVVGHGLKAAAAMGMLRSALSAAVRALQEPGKALDVLDLYSRAVDGALASTAVKVVVHPGSRRLTYSSAGHLPPVLLHPDGTCELLDKSTDPPLGTRPLPVSRPAASLDYGTGDTLVLYTDGLIERRGEDIDAGLHRLTDALARYGTADTERLADGLLARLGVAGGARDDIALIIVRL